MAGFAIRYAAPAKSDLEEIADYLDREAGPMIAKGVLQRPRSRVRRLEHDALRYRERPELGNGRRAILVSPYLVFYRVVNNTVYVQRILHSARNITEDMFPA